MLRGSTTHEDVDVMANSMAEEEHGVQDEAERLATCRNMSIEGERGSALAQGRSTTTDEEIDQRNEVIIDNVPEDPPVPPPPLNRPPNVENEPPSIELEGERISHASCDVRLTADKVDTSGLFIGVEDDGNRPEKLQNMSECEHKGSKRSSQENSAGRPGEEPDNPGGETIVPGGVHDIQERPRNVRHPRWTYQATRTCRGQIGQIKRAGYVTYGQEM